MVIAGFRSGLLVMASLVAQAASAQLLEIDEVELGRLLAEPQPSASGVPTAEDLSEPGALQAYLDDAFATTPGEIRLPSGVIRYTETLRIQRRNGGVIRGAGAVYASDDPEAPQHGWRDPKVRRGTLLHYAGPADEPAVRVRDSLQLVLADFAIQADGATGIRFEVTRGWGNNHHTLERVGFIASECGVECGREGLPYNCADISFQGCLFHRCPTGFRSHAPQNVDFWFTDGCYWLTCDRPIDLVKGGNVSVRDAGTNGPMTAFLTIRQGGVNAAVSKIDFLRIDRTGGSPEDRFRVVDASRARGGVRVVVDALQITNLRGDDWSGWKLFSVAENNHPGHRIDVRMAVAPKGADLKPGKPDAERE